YLYYSSSLQAAYRRSYDGVGNDISMYVLQPQLSVSSAPDDALTNVTDVSFDSPISLGLQLWLPEGVPSTPLHVGVSVNISNALLWLNGTTLSNLATSQISVGSTQLRDALVGGNIATLDSNNQLVTRSSQILLTLQNLVNVADN